MDRRRWGPTLPFFYLLFIVVGVAMMVLYLGKPGEMFMGLVMIAGGAAPLLPARRRFRPGARSFRADYHPIKLVTRLVVISSLGIFGILVLSARDDPPANILGFIAVIAVTGALFAYYASRLMAGSPVVEMDTQGLALQAGRLRIPWNDIEHVRIERLPRTKGIDTWLFGITVTPETLARAKAARNPLLRFDSWTTSGGDIWTRLAHLDVHPDDIARAAVELSNQDAVLI